MAENTNTNFWRVRWDDAPTAGGSSGSPLFEDWNDRIIGWDSYGLAGCNLVLTTHYGKLRKAWTGPSSAKRLRNWLDPNDNDKTGIDGRDPCFNNVIIDDRDLRSAQFYYQPENNVIIQAGNELSTSNSVKILSNADYTFRAGNRIVLNPGFKTASGSFFKAEISNCQQYKYSPIKSSRITNSMNETEESDVLKTNDLIESDFQIKILPNPNNGKFSLDVNTDKPFDIIVFNNFGQEIYKNEKITSNYYPISLNNTKKGTYIIKIIIDNKIFTKKLIIM